MSRFTLDDLPERYRHEVLRQLQKGKPIGLARAKQVRQTEVQLTDETLPPRVCDPEPQHDAADEPLAADKREGQGQGRVVVRIERRATKLLDKDNLYGSAKWVCDALRFAGCIRDDDPESIDLIVTQRRVATRKACGTAIEIDLP